MAVLKILVFAAIFVESVQTFCKGLMINLRLVKLGPMESMGERRVM
jgi:hypothetical protein